VLSIGLILAQDGPKVIDYDVRFGDPETQSLLPLLKTDLAEIMVACIEQRLDEIEITLKDGFCVTVVVYAKGYPGSIKVGKLIQLDVLTVSNGKLEMKIAANEFLISLIDEYLFHSGTAKSDGQLYSTKGRVLAFSATGTSLEKASTLAYKSAQRDHFEESYYRTDIGKL
jgi:phosphoribosylamine-glycine ligase